MDNRLRSMDNKFKHKFNEVASAYDKMRPTYVQALFEDVIRFSNLDGNKKALEVGIGTGQATLPFLQTGCHVTAIEIGEELARFSQDKFSKFQNFNGINKDFESVELDENAYDLFYCASAFHWIPKEIGYTKALRILKNGGAFALFFNRPFPVSETDPTHMAIQKVYEKYTTTPMKSHHFIEEDCAEIINAIQQYGFIDAHYILYHNTRTFDAKNYVALLNTYSPHRAMPENERALLEKEIMDAIDSGGGTFTLHDTMDLYLARKP